MDGHERENLKLRLNNCLQTILEMEQELEKLDMSRKFIAELEVLKGFMSKMEMIQISEDEVERIESATGNFLNELKLPMARLETEKKMFMRLQ